MANDSLLNVMAGDAGMTVCMENMTGTFADSTQNTLAVLEGVDMDSFRLNWDPGNLEVVEKGSYPAAYDRLKSFVGHFHMKDVLRDARSRP